MPAFMPSTCLRMNFSMSASVRIDAEAFAAAAEKERKVSKNHVCLRCINAAPALRSRKTISYVVPACVPASRRKQACETSARGLSTNRLAVVLTFG